MNKKFIIPALALFLVGCGPTTNPTSAPTSTPSVDPTSAPAASYNVVLDHVQTGLGSAVVTQTSDTGSHELVVTPISGVTVKEVTLNGEALTLTEGKASFEATANGSDTVKVTYNVPEITSELAGALIEYQLGSRSVNGFSYTYREHILHNVELYDYTNDYRTYDARLYNNGLVAGVQIGKAAKSIPTYDPEFQAAIEVTGEFKSYKYDDNYYGRGLQTDTPSEEGFFQLLERNAFYDEKSEDLGFNQFVEKAYDNMTGTMVDWTEDFGYTYLGFSYEETEEDYILQIRSTADFQDFPEEGWALSAEDNNYRTIVDKETFEISRVSSKGAVYQTDVDSPIVNLYETVYDNFSYGDLVEGQISEIDLTNINPEYVDLLPEIQVLEDGELSKEDACKVLDNLWAYTANSKECVATGRATKYDDNWNEVYGNNTQTISAYKDNVLMMTNEFVADGSDEVEVQVLQRRPVEGGIANVAIIDGEVSEYDSYINFVGMDYHMNRMLSATPYAHDFLFGTGVSDAILYGLETYSVTDEWGTTAYEVNSYNAVKEGNDITIEWEVFSYYGDPEWGSSSYFCLKIVDNFLAYVEVGETKGSEINTVYNVTQGEFEEYTGTLYDLPENGMY